MARTLTMKLIVETGNKNPPDGLLFDIEKDPLEMKNVYNDPAYTNDRSHLMSAIQEWMDKTPLQEMYVNQEALQINQPNVPPLDLSHRSGIVEYYREKMKEH